MAVIKAIETGTIHGESGRWGGYDGIKLTLSDGETWAFGISNMQDCCESWGYVDMPIDEREKFIGAEFIRVDPIRDESKRSDWGDCEDVHFVDVVTSLGVLSFNVYNYHNGYYGHGVSLFHNGEYVNGA